MIKSYFDRGGFEAAALILAAFIGLIGISQSAVQTSKSIERQLFVPPPKNIQFFTFGYRDTFADTLWIRLIQNFEECGAQKVSKDAVCNDSWAFRMLDSIADLSPKFKIAYINGGTVLSVITHDQTGAGKIFQKGIGQFPNDWSLLYRAGYHFMAELNDRETAAKYFEQAYENGGPRWIPALVGKLLSEIGRLEIAEKVLTDILKDMPEDDVNRERVELRLKEVRQKLASQKTNN